MNTRNILLAALSGATFVALSLTAAPAEAWFERQHFAARWGYGNGNHFTDSPRSMYACNACHIGSEVFPPNQRIQLQVTSQRVNGNALESYDLFTSGYVPGDTYKIFVEMIGEHRGHYTNDGMYEGPEGAFFKIDCPNNDPNGDFFNALHNRNHITAEVMNEDEVYADFDGNAAGRVRPDAQGGPTAQGACAPCDAGENTLPPAQEFGGTTSVMVRRYELTDPAAGDFGGWTCGVCDALVSNVDAPVTPDSEAGFGTTKLEFFWQAPMIPPATGGGRVRFYMSAIDGDGYGDTDGDDFATRKVAVFPAGVNPPQCDPDVWPGWGLGLTRPGPTPTASSRASSPSRHAAAPSRRTSAALWVPALMTAALGLVVIAFWRRRPGLGRLRS